ncbi:MAG TPA: guanylate kinase [Gaiellaceae bacterium]|nr:guanylate kinase [Gaiellaceae bacterium]
MASPTASELSSLGSSTSNGPPVPVFVVTGTSGAGKGTLERALLSEMPDLELAISATTRGRRESEQDGREYWFISDEEFDEKLSAGEFLEYVEFPWGQRSGTLRSEIDRIKSHGRIPLLDLEPQGALDVKRSVQGAVTIFVEAPSFAENERRLRERATESEGEIEERLELAREQLSQAGEFDLLIVNDDLDRAVGELAEIVKAKLSASMSRP